MTSINRKFIIANQEQLPIANHSGFQIISEIGKNGIVFEAKPDRLSRIHAIKVFIRDDGLDVEERFYEEIDKISKLKHPNIVIIHDASQFPQDSIFPNLPYAIYEYIEGKNLDDWLNTKPTFWDKISVFEELNSTIIYYHEQGVYHGDLHGKNIIIDEQLKPHIIDFSTSIFVRRKDQNPAIRESKVLINTFLEFFKDEDLPLFLDLPYLQQISPKCIPHIFSDLKELIVRQKMSIEENFDPDEDNGQLISNIAYPLQNHPVYQLDQIILYYEQLAIDTVYLKYFMYGFIKLKLSEPDCKVVRIDEYDGVLYEPLYSLYNKWKKEYFSKHKM